MACAVDVQSARLEHLAPVRRVAGGVPRVAAVSAIDHPKAGQSETFEAHRTSERRRLSADHQHLCRYVFSDWACEVGARSNCETVIQQMIEAGRGVELVAAENRSQLHRRCDRCLLPRRSARSQCPRCGYAPQEIYCHPPKAGVVRVGTGLLFAQERWSDDRDQNRRGGGAIERRANVARAWRTLRSLDRRETRAVREHRVTLNPAVILHALYGDRPPGMMLPDGTWPKAFDGEYRRVVRQTDMGAGSETNIEKRLHLDKHRRREADGQDEPEPAWRARIVAAEVARRALLLELGKQCERLIVAATDAFEQAWETLGS
jgi:hypothetical protein